MIMKTISLFLFLVACASRVGVLAAETNLNVSRVLDRPLSEVRAALQTFCAEMRHGSTAPIRTNDVPGDSYSVSWSDCAPPRGLVGYWQGEAVAKYLTPSRTLLEIRPTLGRDHWLTMPTTNAMVIEGYMTKIVAILERKK